jgi:hypothetical protein
MKISAGENKKNVSVEIEINKFFMPGKPAKKILIQGRNKMFLQ